MSKPVDPIDPYKENMEFLLRSIAMLYTLRNQPDLLDTLSLLTGYMMDLEICIQKDQERQHEAAGQPGGTG